MPKRLQCESRTTGGSPSRPKQESRSLESIRDFEREVMLDAGMGYLDSMGVDTRDENAVIILNADETEVILHFPGQEVEEFKSIVFLMPAFSGVVLVAFSPSVTKGDGFPGAIICSKVCERMPSTDDIHQIVTERWQISGYAIV